MTIPSPIQRAVEIGDKVMVFSSYETPQYTGEVMGISKRGLLIKKDGWFGGLKMERAEYVDLLLTSKLN